MAYTFDGTNDNLSSVENGISTIDNDVITLAAWVWVDATPSSNLVALGGCSVFAAGGQHTAFTIRAPASAGFIFRWFMNFDGAANGSWDADADITAAAWHHICVTHDGSDANNNPIIYIDSASVAFTETTTPLGSRTTGTDSFRLGENANAGQDFAGRVAEVVQYDRILSAGEAGVLGAKFSPKFVPRGSLLHWPLVDELHDLVGGNILTANGATVSEQPTIYLPEDDIIPFPTPTADAAGTRRQRQLPSFTRRRRGTC